MEIKRVKAEPLPPPPDTVDITGLTLREAGALRALLCEGVTWGRQEADLRTFFNSLAGNLPYLKVSLDFSDLHRDDDEF